MAPKRTIKSMKQTAKELEGSSMSVIKAKDVKTELDNLKEHYKESPAKTLKTYVDNYKKVQGRTEGRELKDVPLEDMILIVGGMSESYASQKAYLNIWSLCNFRINNILASVPYKKYVEYLERGIQSQMKVTHEIKMEFVATQEKIIEHENKMYESKNYVAYVVCRLMNHLLCRNKDVNLFVVDDMDDIDDINDGNFLICGDKESCLIRNDYKTVRKYGQLCDYIPMDAKLRTALENIPKKEYLFPGADTSGKLQNRLKKCLYTNEVGYLNSAIEMIKKSGNLSRLREISLSRGTSLEQLLTSYDLGHLLG